MGKRCCFAGHREIYEEFKDKLKNEIEGLINEGVDEFWVGHYGVFDKASAQVVRELKKTYQNIRLILVLPYTTEIINRLREKYYKEFDELLIADIPGKTPVKYRIIKCNEYMVKNSDYLICYVKYSWGGALKTFEYAKKKKHIKIMNLAK